MNVISIGFDRAVFDEKSEARARLVLQAAQFEELHMIVFSRKSHELQEMQFGNIFLYPTDSRSRWLYIRDAVRIGMNISERWKVESGKTRNDFVVTSQDPFETGLAAVKIATRSNLPLHVQIHTDFLNPYFEQASFLNKIRVLIARRILPKASGIRVVSNRILKSLDDSGLELKAAPTVLPVFVDLSRFVGGSKDFLKKKYPQFSNHILCVSRLSPEKNLCTALRAFAKVVLEIPKSGLVIIGDGAERAKLQTLARNLKVESSVIFEGAVGIEELPAYYGSADCFLQTSLFEGFGRSLLEAAASRTPIVSTDCGIARELTDYVCPVGETNCLAEKIIRFLRESKLREECVSKAFNKASAMMPHDAESYAKAYAKILTI